MHSLSNRQTIGQTCLSCAAVEGATRPSLYSVYSEYKYGVGSNPCFLCIFRHFINMQITWMLSSNFGLCILRLFIFSYFYTFSPVMIVLIVQFLIYCHIIYVLSWTIVNSIYNYFPRRTHHMKWWGYKAYDILNLHIFFAALFLWCSIFVENIYITVHGLFQLNALILTVIFYFTMLIQSKQLFMLCHVFTTVALKLRWFFLFNLEFSILIWSWSDQLDHPLWPGM